MSIFSILNREQEILQNNLSNKFSQGDKIYNAAIIQFHLP